MLSRAVKRAPLLALSIFALASCSRSLPTFRYRLTVDIDTPVGIRSGSSVVEVKTIDQGSGFPGPEAGGFRFRAMGEAVVIRMPNNTLLFALLRDQTANPTNFATGVPYATYEKELPAGSEPYKVRHAALIQMKGARSVPKDHTPLFVRFTDINDPLTVEEVSPESFVKVYGPGTSLRSVEVEINNQPVRFTIKKLLPWTEQVRGKQLDGVRIRNTDTLANTLSLRDFYRELPSP